MVTSVIADVLTAYLVVVFVRVVLSWFPLQADSPVMPLVRVTNALTEPVLAPIRRALPTMRVGAGAIDFSPMVLMFAIIIVRSLI